MYTNKIIRENAEKYQNETNTQIDFKIEKLKLKRKKQKY